MTKTFKLTALLALTLGSALVQPADALPRTATPERLTLKPVAVSLADLEPAAGAKVAAVRDVRDVRLLDDAAFGQPTPVAPRRTVEASPAAGHSQPAAKVERARTSIRGNATACGEPR